MEARLGLLGNQGGKVMAFSCKHLECEVLSAGTSFAVLPLLLMPLVAYPYALYVHASHGEFGHFVMDALLPPVGIIHGIILLFGLLFG